MLIYLYVLQSPLVACRCILNLRQINRVDPVSRLTPLLPTSLQFHRAEHAGNAEVTADSPSNPDETEILANAARVLD